ncbi:helix-turn-helix domain-containing protein [Secundilactobacillus kimchicus]
MLLTLLNEGAVDRQTFCDKMFISQATFSMYRRRVTELLNQYYLGLNSQNSILGDETQIIIFYGPFNREWLHQLPISNKSRL